MEIIPVVVDKNNIDGSYCRTSDAKVFVNAEPIARTLTCKCGGGQEVHHNNLVCVIMEKEECKMLGMLGNEGFEKVRRVDSTNANCPTVSTKDDRIKICEEKTIVAMRGRNPENPNDRKKGSNLEQRLEPNQDGLVNTLTTVQKDNMVLEETIKIKQATKEGEIECKVGGCYDASYPDSKTRRGRVQEGGNVTPTITAQGGENINFVETKYRIRKLTPKECWRLMGYSDEDFEKASKVVSNSQLYKQAGNAIVKQVLMAIFSQMKIQNIKQWNKENA